MSSILRVGLTGGIGSGKSTVGRVMELLGVAVYDSDVRAKWLMANDVELRHEVEKLFGADVYPCRSGAEWLPDRALIAGRIFADRQVREELNGIVHPAVERDFERWSSGIEATGAAPYVVQESAILIEAGVWRLMDCVVVVTAPEELRMQRVVARDSASHEQIRARMVAQISDSERLTHADYCLAADDHQLLLTQVLKLHEVLLIRAQSGI